MRWMNRFWLRLRSLTRRQQVERELADEFAFHMDHQIQENIQSGMSPAEARAAALRTIGGIAQLQEECRDMRQMNYIETFFADVRYAIRGFRKQPGFTVLAILTLTLGIGASVALFSLVNAVLLRPLPFADAGRLVMLWEDNGSSTGRQITPAPADFTDWRTQNHTFEDIAAASWLTFNLTGDGEPERVTGLRVTANYFTVLGVKAAIGRLMEPADDNLESGHVAVISYQLWQRRFANAASIAGRSLTLDGESYTVVGVAPAGFQFPASGADIWIAPGFTRRDLAQRDGHFLYVTGRVKRGVSLKQARADMETIAHRLETQYPRSNTHLGVVLVPLREYYAGNVSLALDVLLGAVAALVLIVCSNLALLFLARGAARRREIAMRAALGAGRGRVARQLFTECAVLAGVCALLGAALSTVTFRFLARLIPGSFPDGTMLHFDVMVFGFTAGLALLATLLFGLAPAIQAGRLDLNQVLKLGSGRGSARGAFGGLQGAIVAVEVGLTVLLLIGAALMLESYIRVRNVNPGFRAENVLTLETSLPAGKYGDLARRARFYRDVVGQTARLPGVISAAYVNFPPLTFGGVNGFFIEGRPRPRLGEGPFGFNRIATSGYLQTIGVPVLRGRFFDERDGPDAPPVLVINQAMARAYWPGEDALGARVRFGDGGPGEPVYTVIGIAGDVRQISLSVAPRPEFYLSATQNGRGGWPRTLVIRTMTNPLALAPSVRRVIAGIDPNQPVANVRTMDDALDADLVGRQTQTAIVSAFAMSALLLASIGLYGVLSYAVAQRKTEIGIRMALGAQRGEVIRNVIAQALRWTALGIVCGLAGAFLLTRLFSTLLFNVSPSDPHTFAGATLLTFGVAVAASFIPAYRAATADPVTALRQE